MQIGYLSTLYHTSFQIKNIQTKIQGNTLEWKLFSTGPAMLEAFSSGEIDLGYIGLPPVIIGLSRGLKLKCVAGGHIEGTVLVATEEFDSYNNSTDIDSLISQFKGKTIGVPSKGSIHDVILRKITAGTDIQIKNYPWADFIPSALQDGAIDAGVGTPALAVASSHLASTHIVIPPNFLWPWNPSYGIVSSEDLINQNPEFIKDFLVNHEKMCNFIKNSPIQAAEIATKELGIKDVNFGVEIFKISPGYCASLPPEYIESSLKFVPELQKQGYIESKFNKSDIFYTEIIKEVHPENHHYK
ncbi:ABC transporter substrate-binding protein [Methanobacterium alkalithermotolerans]|uniref:ABC transporter substrate-binding protein n=1 Tax=Methanobacterium alkalithermotolerans TaxID=2731220 RepID=A0A8T8K3E9_9EURY|nr:ABC transporter substrate-binding protein [Methanobacterium alkalithermotolerans]QUH22507.1 ABC transporter substrate-binding protein [Methanobacterium alkalithermotolerans]